MIYNAFLDLYTAVFFGQSAIPEAGAVFLTVLTITSCAAVFLLPFVVVFCLAGAIKKIFSKKFMK